MMNTDWLDAFEDDEGIPPNEKVDHLLAALVKNQAEMEQKAAPFRIDIEAQQVAMAKVILGHQVAESRIKGSIWNILEEFYPDDRHDSDVGTAQIVRPKNRISYDTKGLETLRLSSDQVDRLIAHLRKEAPSKPYLKVSSSTMTTAQERLINTISAESVEPAITSAPFTAHFWATDLAEKKVSAPVSMA